MDIRNFFGGVQTGRPAPSKSQAPKPKAHVAPSKSASRTTRTRQTSPSKRKQPVVVVESTASCAVVQGTPQKLPVPLPKTQCSSLAIDQTPKRDKQTAKAATVKSPKKAAASPKKSPTAKEIRHKSPKKKPVAQITVLESSEYAEFQRTPKKAATVQQIPAKDAKSPLDNDLPELNGKAVPSLSSPRVKRRRVQVVESSDDEERPINAVEKRADAAKNYRKPAASCDDAENPGHKIRRKQQSAVQLEKDESPMKKKASKAANDKLVVKDSEDEGDLTQESLCLSQKPLNTITSFIQKVMPKKPGLAANTAAPRTDAKASLKKAEVSISDYFGTETVHHIKPAVCQRPRSKASTECKWDDIDSHDDKDFQMVLQQMDEQENILSNNGSATAASGMRSLSSNVGESTLASKLKELTGRHAEPGPLQSKQATPKKVAAGTSPARVRSKTPVGENKGKADANLLDEHGDTGAGCQLSMGPRRNSPRKARHTPSKDDSTPGKRAASGAESPAVPSQSPTMPGAASARECLASSLKKSPVKRAASGVDVDSPRKKPKNAASKITQAVPDTPLALQPAKAAAVSVQLSPIKANVAAGMPESPAASKDLAIKTEDADGDSTMASGHDGSRTPGKKGSAYRAYLMRPQTPRAPGSKTIPEGASNCFEGLTFVLTGVLESLERDEAKSLIERYGGKVTGNVSKKTSYVVKGEDAGEAKLKKAKQNGTPLLTEDGLLDLLRTLPGKKSKFAIAAEKEAAKKMSPRKGKPRNTDAVHETGDAVEDEAERAAGPAAGAVSSRPCLPGDSTGLLWVDKYKPKKSKDLIGQQGERSNAKKLLAWLQDWHKNRAAGVKPVSNFGRFGGGSDTGAGFRAALLSGPPGIGKTTTAQIVCQEAGFTYFELNASDTRSRLSLQAELSAALGSNSIASYATPAAGSVPSGHMHCVLMDEVDGMAGNEDRGGLQELVALIKTTHIPIVCMCNDRNNPKMRTLSNYCFDLRFQRPRVDQIKAAMMSIAYKEGLKVEPAALNDIIQASNQDIRQVIHNLSMCTAASKSLTYAQSHTNAAAAKKDTVLGPFDVCMKVFSDEFSNASLIDKSDLFFYDYNIAPLFVQENYPISHPSRARDLHGHLRSLARAADSIADGDVVSNMIRRNQNWNLLPIQAMYSSVLPGEAMRGRISKMVEFPKWLGRNSSRGKFDRMVQELQFHMRLAVSANRCDMSCDYLPALRNCLTAPLMDEAGDGSGGIECVLGTMEEYSLQREDYDNILEMTQWPHTVDPRSRIPPKVKAAFTRAYNKEGFRAPYGTDIVPRKSRASAQVVDEEGAAVEEGTGEVAAAASEHVGGEDEPDEEDETKALEALKKLSKNSKPKQRGTSGKAAGASGKSKKTAPESSATSRRGSRKANGY